MEKACCYTSSLMLKKIALSFFSLLFFCCCQAQIRLATVFGDHMVLQQQSAAPVWGWASPGDELTIAASWDNVEIKTTTSRNGTWKATLNTPKAGGPYVVVIKNAYQTVQVRDVMIGEVWICSGQSNMQWTLEGATEGAFEISKADLPDVRLFNISRSAADFPQVRGEGTWEVCTPSQAKNFSAVGYFFGKRLHENLKVPVGLISASWGGTPAEAWTPDSLVTSNPRLLASANKLPVQKWGPRDAGKIYNSMVCPLIPFAIAGVIWYQGESNVAAPDTYRELMETMIQAWRTAFMKEFPFYYVQIAPYTYRNEKSYLVRDQQTKTLSVPNTGMVVISDIVDDVKDIHPRRKQPVGERLANYALGNTYGLPGLHYKHPLYNAMKIEKAKARLYFVDAPNGLISRNGAPDGFMIAGEDQNFVPATARIEGNTVVVYAKEVKKPVAVRFAWDNAFIPNLFSKEGLPVSCFKTDDWPE